MSKFWKSFTAILTAAMVASILGGTASGSAADAETVETKVTIQGAKRHGALKVKGNVLTLNRTKDHTDASSCATERKIVLFRINSKGRAVREKVTQSGRWSQYSVRVGDAPHGKYFAKATRKLIADGYGDLVVCAADTSPKVKI